MEGTGSGAGVVRQADLIAADIDAYLAQHEQKELLRFITCGSVDDGKSTLIGRMFYDSKLIYEDTLAALQRDSAIHGTTGGGFDPALFTDGLKAEREQGITIDVAYRYFSTAKRKFIIADTPGHVQYTRNMATGASTADLAVILVDARNGVVEQTKRHTFIVTLLGIKHILVAVNKMDLVDFREAVFEQIRSDYRDFAARLDLPDLHFIPISALLGDNVVDPSPNMPWYQGSPLLAFLDNVYIGSDRNLEDFRFPVQYVCRPHLDFRGYAGSIASGIVRQGDDIIVLPSRKASRVKQIVTLDGELAEAFTPMSVMLTLEDEIDVSRGNMIVRPGNVPNLATRFEAAVVWMAETPMVPGKSYFFKQTTQTVSGTFSTLRYQIDVNTLHRRDAPALGLNEIGRCAVSLTEPLAFDSYQRNRSTGAFIVIDRLSNGTVGAGMILDRRTSETRQDHWDAPPPSTTLHEEVSQVTPGERSARYGQRPVTLLLSGLPGSGKTPIAYALERQLFNLGRSAVVVDGQNLRLGLTRDLGFSPEDRSENVRRAAEVARLVNDAGLICILSLVAPNEEVRQRAAEVIGPDRFFVVHVDAGQREPSPAGDDDAAKSEAGLHYEPPTDPAVALRTDQISTTEAVARLVEWLEHNGVIGG